MWSTGSPGDELEGIANRTDFDLKAHAEASGQDLRYFDQDSGERYYPYVIEPSAGITRSAFAFLLDAYDEEEVRGEKRVVLRLHPRLAPIKVAVLPLSKKEGLMAVSREVATLLRPHWPVEHDTTQSIGRRYRRQDEIGTPLAVTVDFDTLDDQAVTIRERDTMEQVRVPIAGLVETLRERFAGSL
jgi:glycyl-tRNA synthetase